jgi:hypothetical protein
MNDDAMQHEEVVIRTGIQAGDAPRTAGGMMLGGGQATTAPGGVMYGSGN